MTSQDNIIEAALFTPGLNGRWGIPLLLWGEPGTGKTTKLRSIARRCGLFFNGTNSAICEPSDLKGYPIPNEERTMVNSLPAPWIHEVNSAGAAMQVFDEATSTSQAGHAALMGIILEGRAGDVPVNPRVRFMLAANPVGCAANPTDLAIPLANRFGHLQWDPGDSNDWINWLLSGGSDWDEAAAAVAEDPDHREGRVLAKWDKAYADAKGKVAGFIKRFGSQLHMMPSADNPDSSLAWASRRTWEMATRALAGSDINGLSGAETLTFIAALIGPGVAGEFSTFINDLDLPDTIELLKGKVTFKHVKSRLDRTMVVLSQCASFLVAPIKNDDAKKSKLAERNDMVDAYWKLACTIMDAGSQDLVIPSARIMVEHQLDTRLNNMGPAREAMLKITPLVRRTHGQGV